MARTSFDTVVVDRRVDVVQDVKVLILIKVQVGVPACARAWVRLLATGVDILCHAYCSITGSNRLPDSGGEGEGSYSLPVALETMRHEFHLVGPFGLPDWDGWR
eukprot:COSAG01_NODE_4809_length_4726_cov_9.458612_3_plen_104_part_00